MYMTKKKNSIYHIDKPLVETVFDQKDNYLKDKYHIRYNKLSHYCDIKPISSNDWEIINVESLYIELRQNNIKTCLKNLEIYLKSNFIERFDPLEDYFESLPKWDGADYISDYVSYVDFEDLKQATYHFKKWLVRTVKCALIDEYVNKQCFVLFQKEQNRGKTTWLRNLCPPKLSDYIAEDIGVDKDSRIALTRNFLINIDEISYLDKSTINKVKSVLSKAKINDRLPYDKVNSIIPRRSSYVASTNDNDFLNDPTGSVRWLCFAIKGKIDFSYKDKFNIDKMWSQAYHLAFEDDKFESELTSEDVKLNEKRNSKFFNQNIEYELIDKYFQKSESKDDFKTPTEIIQLLEFSDRKLNNIRAGKALTALGYNKVKHSTRQAYGYLASFNQQIK